MILTVTLNVALDVTYQVDALVPGAAHRVRSVAERPGGKGLNVARVLHALGEPVIATGLIGGAAGARARDLLETKHAFVEIAGESRRTVVVTDGSDATGFWEPGPEVSADEWAEFVRRYTGLVAVARVVVLSGSLPRGVPVDAYAQLVATARERDVPTVLDTSGEPLLRALAAGPDVIKPNAEELAEAMHAGRASESRNSNVRQGTTDPGFTQTSGAAPAPAADAGYRIATAGLAHIIECAEALRTAGARTVLASRGPDGMLAVTADGCWHAAPPAPVAGNPTGAGDSAVAAVARGLAYRKDWPSILADAVALSAAAVLAPEAGAFDQIAYRRFCHAVTSQEL
ncbi:1-phosphofructokinase family hexose kinase [Longispora urticae]